MKKPSKLPFKIDIPFILFLVFFIASIFLSFKLKVQKENCAQQNAQQHEQEMQNLSYRLALLNQTFKDNYKIAGEKLLINNPELFTGLVFEENDIPVLYLKEDACSDCYVRLIEAIINRLGNVNQFHVISHSSNRYFINLMLRLKTIPSDKQVTWTDEEIYSDDYSYSTADLFIINSDMDVRLFLPLDFLNDSYFFEEYMLFLENELMQDSIN